MTDHRVRPLSESEFRDAQRLELDAELYPPLSEELSAAGLRRWEPGRVFGAFHGDELIGTAGSMRSSLAVPGGVVPAAAVTNVGVRADRTRRGVLTAMMRAQLDNVRARGEPVAMLLASEAMIYGRFGYGPATRSRTVSLDTRRATMRPDAPGGGHVRLVELSEARKLLPEIYRRIGLHRPGMIGRSDGWWYRRLLHGPDRTVFVAVHTSAEGVDDGFAGYYPTRTRLVDQSVITLVVADLQAANAAAAADLWRFLLGVDLVDTVTAYQRPVDEPVEWWLADRRACRVSSVDDDLWVRLVDVPGALSARAFGDAEPVVIELRDPFLPDNAGTYRIGPGGVERTDGAADLSLDVDVLGAAYLGDVSMSMLAAANRVDVHDPAALPRADSLLATTEPPWCGTGF